MAKPNPTLWEYSGIDKALLVEFEFDAFDPPLGVSLPLLPALLYQSILDEKPPRMVIKHIQHRLNRAHRLGIHADGIMLFLTEQLHRLRHEEGYTMPGQIRYDFSDDDPHTWWARWKDEAEKITDAMKGGDIPSRLATPSQKSGIFRADDVEKSIIDLQKARNTADWLRIEMEKVDAMLEVIGNSTGAARIVRRRIQECLETLRDLDQLLAPKSSA